MVFEMGLDWRAFVNHRTVPLDKMNTGIDWSNRRACVKLYASFIKGGWALRFDRRYGMFTSSPSALTFALHYAHYIHGCEHEAMKL